MNYLACGSSGFLAVAVGLGGVLAIIPASFILAKLFHRFINWFNSWSL